MFDLFFKVVVVLWVARLGGLEGDVEAWREATSARSMHRVAKSMKFGEGLMIHSGNPVNDYVEKACRHVLLRQGEGLPLPPSLQISHSLSPIL